jgi:hypothetical protein
MLRRAYREMDNFAAPASPGSPLIINRPNPNSFTAATVTPAAYGSGEASIITVPETVTLGQPVGVNFAPTDLEVTKSADTGQLSQAMTMAAHALGKSVASALTDVAIVSAYQVIAKTSDALADLADIKDAFADNGIGDADFTLCLPGLSEFTGNANLLHAAIGRGNISGNYGMQTALGEVAYDHSLAGKSFTHGTGTAYVVGAAGAAKGATSIPVEDGSGTGIIGDVVTFASHTGNYVITSAISAGAMSVYPPLRAAVVHNCAISITHTTCTSLGVAVANLGLAFVSRPLQIDPDVRGQTFFATGTDDQSGISLNYEVRREFYQTRRQLSICYAVAKGFPDAIVKYSLAGF